MRVRFVSAVAAVVVVLSILGVECNEGCGKAADVVVCSLKRLGLWVYGEVKIGLELFREKETKIKKKKKYLLYKM